MQLRPVVLVSILLALSLAPVMAETRVGDTIVISQAVPEDFYAVGSRLQIDASVAGDAVLAGGGIDIGGDVDGDVSAASGQIRISGGVGDDLRAAGGEVSLRGFVTDHAAIVGGNVRIEEGSAIAGRAWIAAGSLDMAGQVGADLRVYARTAVISGQVQGNVEINAQEIRIDPGAVIGGQLIWHSGQPPLIAEDALILGEVAGVTVPADELPETAPPVFDGWGLGVAILVAAVAVFWLDPSLVERSAVLLGASPLRTLFTGAVAAVLTPLLIVVFFVSVLGWLLGLLLLLAYVMALLLSGLLGLLMLAQVLRTRLMPQEPVPATGRSRGWSCLVLLLPVTVFALLVQSVPVLGALFSLLVMLAGFGALASLVMRRMPSAR
jgi:cytoskeletal protein CcmA (bactofilin family)